MNNTLSDRLNSSLKDDTGCMHSDEATNENTGNQDGEYSSCESVLNKDILTLNSKEISESDICKADRNNESKKPDCDNEGKMLKDTTETENLPADSVETCTDYSKSGATGDSNAMDQADTKVTESCDINKEENSTVVEGELRDDKSAHGNEDDEDEFADFSEDSGSDAEYESAEEGEEIHADKENLRELEDTLTEEEKEERRNTAQDLKKEGNELFRCGSYKSAIRLYSRALRTCPLKYAKDRAIMYSNRGACKMRLEEHEDCIRDCTKALELHPHYLKALMRRAELYEKTEKLDEALADYQKILEMDPSQHTARAACIKLPDQIKERNEKMKEEMMGKLKDLGNLVLRPFGLSTNNFQMQQDPNTGGYSVNFVQNPGQQ